VQALETFAILKLLPLTIASDSTTAGKFMNSTTKRQVRGLREMEVKFCEIKFLKVRDGKLIAELACQSWEIVALGKSRQNKKLTKVRFAPIVKEFC